MAWRYRAASSAPCVTGPMSWISDDVDAADSQSLEARGEGVPRRLGRVVEHRHQGRGVDVGALRGGVGGPRHEAAPNLRREDERIAGLTAERRADTPLAEPVTVERRGVEVAYAGGPGGRTVSTACASGIGRKRLPSGAPPKPRRVTRTAVRPSARVSTGSISAALMPGGWRGRARDGASGGPDLSAWLILPRDRARGAPPPTQRRSQVHVRQPAYQVRSPQDHTAVLGSRSEHVRAEVAQSRVDYNRGDRRLGTEPCSRHGVPRPRSRLSTVRRRWPLRAPGAEPSPWLLRW